MAGQERGIWDDLLQAVRERIPEVEFRTWFDRVHPLGFADGAYQIGVPHSFAKEWISTHYSDVLEAALKDLGADAPRVGFQVLGPQASEQRDLFSGPPEPRPEARRDAAGRVSGSNGAAGQDRPRTLPTLNPKYVFDNFVVGPNNHLATAAAHAVADSPGTTYNPLFLYGESGLGKTHLMQAVGHAVVTNLPDKVVEYVTTESFTNDLINAIQDKRMQQFRDRYRNVDVLLIDDIQFIAGKERTQEEFFHTFNTLYEYGKQIIVSSDRPPKDIPTLEKRLRSRFEWGLITDLTAPELETRMAILRMNAEYRGVKLPQEVVDYIARHVTSNIRELEGALVRSIVYASMNQAPLNRQTVARALSEVFAPSDENLTMDDILGRVAKELKVEAEALRGRGRKKELVAPRQIAMYLMRELTSHSFPEIGKFFGGRDHSTVMYAVQRVTAAVENDSGMERIVRSLREGLV